MFDILEQNASPELAVPDPSAEEGKLSGSDPMVNVSQYELEQP